VNFVVNVSDTTLLLLYNMFFKSTITFSYSIIALNCYRQNYYSSEGTRVHPMILVGFVLLDLYPYLKWQWIFYFLCRCFLSSITA